MTFALEQQDHIAVDGKMGSPKEFKQVDARLREWGRWLLKCYDNGIGYPSRSTLVTALEGSRSTAKFYPKDNDFAVEIHLIIIKMGHNHKEWEGIVKIEYACLSALSQTAKAVSLGLSRIQYRNMLNNAKSWIESAIV